MQKKTRKLENSKIRKMQKMQKNAKTRKFENSKNAKKCKKNAKTRKFENSQKRTQGRKFENSNIKKNEKMQQTKTDHMEVYLKASLDWKAPFYFLKSFNIFTRPTFRKSCDEGKSDFFFQQSGIRQGCTLFPYLFILVMSVMCASLLAPLKKSRHLDGYALGKKTLGTKNKAFPLH